MKASNFSFPQKRLTDERTSLSGGYDVPTTEFLIGGFALFGIVFLMALYAIALNDIFYKENIPFYDSIVYYAQLAIVMAASKAVGFFKNINDVLDSSGSTTTILPFVEGALLGKWVEPSRAVAVWFYALWVWALGTSVFFYFRKFYTSNLWLSIALSLPFMGIFAVWHYNGGLSDFRMDLHLYLLGAAAFTWFLATYNTDKIYPWLLCGAFIGLTCLARSLAPAHFIITLIPLLCLRFFLETRQNRLELAQKTAYLLLAAAITCGWYYFFKFDEVYQYYAISNIDANAKLPWSKSSRHIYLLFRNIGWFPIVVGGILLPFNISNYFKSYRALTFWKDINWKALWLGWVPVLFLVIRGAGPNPFVSMIGAFGIVLFLVQPFNVQHEPAHGLSQSAAINSFLALVLVILFTIPAVHAIDERLTPPPNVRGGMQAYKAIVEAILRDARQVNLSKATFAVPFVASINETAIWNVFIYDFDEIRNKNIGQGFFNRLQPTLPFSIVSPLGWQALPGETDEKKVQRLIKIAERTTAYILMPEDKTITYLEENQSQNTINIYTRRIKQELLANKNWVPVSDVIDVVESQSIRVYRNNKRVP